MLPMPKITCAIAFAAVMSASAAFAQAPVAQKQGPATMLLIDGSGSMWARFNTDKIAKFDAVREQMTAAIQASSTTDIAIASFGHRRRGDCSDVEILSGFSPPDGVTPRDGALAALAKLDPRGKGPLVGGLRAAFAEIGTKRPATIIALADGVDNCQQDACAAASELAAAQPGIAVHMIALNVEAALQPKLSCIATATGGSFAAPDDSAQLQTAIDAAAKVAMLTRPAAEPQAESQKALPPGSTTLRARVALVDGGTPLSVPARWRIFAAGGVTPLADSATSEVSARLDPGTYDVEVQVGKLKGRATVTVEEGRASELIVPLNAAHLKITARLTPGTPVSNSAVITVVPAGDTNGTARPPIIAQSGDVDVIIAAGDYDIAVTDGTVRRRDKISLKPGAVEARDEVLDAGRLELSVAGAPDGPHLDDVLYILERDDTESADGRREVVRSRSSVARLTLAAGTYYVTAKSGSGEVRQRIAVGSGETVQQRLMMPLATVKISATIAGRAASDGDGLVYRVTELDGEKREIVRALKPSLDLKMSPGRYRIAAHLDAHHIVTAQDISVEGALPVDVVIKLDAAAVRLKTSAPFVSESYWEVRDAAGNPVWHAMVAEPEAVLSPGRYTVTLETRAGRKSAAFEALSGQQHTIEVGENAPQPGAP